MQTAECSEEIIRVLDITVRSFLLEMMDSTFIAKYAKHILHVFRLVCFRSADRFFVEFSFDKVIILTVTAINTHLTRMQNTF